ncbi:MAG: hypothetical protein ACLR8Y_09095 [Alistipes indistinctus]
MKAYRHILLVTGLLLTLFAFAAPGQGRGWEHHDTSTRRRSAGRRSDRRRGRDGRRR